MRSGQIGSSRRGATHLWVLAFTASCVCLIGLLGRGHGYRVRLERWLGRGEPERRAVKAEVILGSVAEGRGDPAIRFQNVPMPPATGAGFTCVQVGPDHRLYASSDDGRIFRFAIFPDGSVGQPAVIKSLQTAAGGKRLVTGFCFDPAAPPDAPVLWVAHGFFSFHGAPDFSGRITVMRGPDLDIVEDVVVNLPRSFKDHLTNQPSFGPDGALYIPQGSNTAYGAADAVWGDRPERRLNASILRLDVTKVTPGNPLDVRTPDGGGSYDPDAPGAPLTIYAEGLRNAYDLVWASDGHLYVPVNGSSAGGNTPAGPGVPGLTDVPISEDDWLFRITPGKYYGHPNPQQGHFVLNGGNPGNRHDSATVANYPVGTPPDRNWEPAVFDFGPHVSADGIIEYRGNAFGGKLDRKLLVCRFNVGSDLICLGLDASGHVNFVQTAIPGLEHLINPLDVAEDLSTGNLYVAEYGGRRISLFRPIENGSAPLLRQPNQTVAISPAAREGRRLFALSCIACHGPDGQGIPHLGADLCQSKFIASHDDNALAEFIARGRQPGDPNSVLGLIMPPKGGNPSLDESSIHQIVAYLRTLNSRPLQNVAAVDAPSPSR